jgi:hypothetical protein
MEIGEHNYTINEENHTDTEEHNKIALCTSPCHVSGTLNVIGQPVIGEPHMTNIKA